MHENRKQLISKLKSLNPTEGEWRTYSFESHIGVITDEPRNVDDRILITLAPSMREELLKMEEEMEKMKQIAEDLLERIISADTNVINSPSNADRVISIIYKKCLQLIKTIH